jgi:hypothetical protein
VRRAAKRDANEGEIIAALEAVGARVFRVSDGHFPDLAVLYGGRWHLLEVKAQGGTLTPGQVAFVASVEKAGGRVHVVRTGGEAVAAVRGEA